MKFQLHCKTCGGTNLFSDACAEWDPDTQAWVLASVYDHTDCGDCDGECFVVERPYVEETQDD